MANIDISSVINKYGKGYSYLDGKSVEILMNFNQLWGIFEHDFFECERVNAANIKNKVMDLLKNRSVNNIFWNDEIRYFRERYFPNGEESQLFKDLRLYRERENIQTFVRKVMLEESSNNQDSLAACLIIVWRFRNNFFHGVKLDYEFKEQPDNLDHFVNCNKLLASFIDHFLEEK